MLLFKFKYYCEEFITNFKNVRVHFNVKYKILHVVSTLGYGGVSKVVLNYYENIDHSKYQFDFITHGGKEDFHENLIENGSNIFYIKTIKKSNLISYIKNGLKILRENGPYDAVHVHTDYQAGIFALIAKIAGVKIRICHSHRIDVPNKIARYLTPIFRKLMVISATELVACSNEAGKFLFGNKDFTIIKNAIDLNLFKQPTVSEKENLRCEFNIDQGWNGLIIGHVGNFNEVKNQEFFLPVIEALSNRNIDFKLIFVGDGPLKNKLKDDFERLGFKDKVIFAGIRNDIPSMMHLFDVFVLPSKFEGLGIVAIEAQAAGTPCVVSDTTPNESDMGLSLIRYIDLKVNINLWVEEILKSYNEKIYHSPEEINKQVSKKGYNIKNTVDDLLELYSIAK